MKHQPTTVFPPELLQQHNAIIGKTGSGKTITGKLMIEQAFPSGATICILDPLKSDWWGLTLDADGKRPGLPFDILGGPYGHVPLHASAGAAIGELVATGALRHSIIDMADFGPGEHNQFFVDFAEEFFSTKTRENGVAYLVLEEAHVFCPKERDGVKGENMAIYHMKRLASASRSKGIRLIALTQRTQALHNAVLGSCDNLTVHRLTLPADKKPAIDWIKGTLDPETVKTISGSLASLKTGEGWICPGEGDGVARRMKFPMIRTYDNSATPTGEISSTAVRPPPVDQAKLRSIIGEALKEAEAKDPVKLKERIQDLEDQLADAKSQSASEPAPVDTAAIEQLQADVEQITMEKNQSDERLAMLGEAFANRIERAVHLLTSAYEIPDEVPGAMAMSPSRPLGDIPPAPKQATPISVQRVSRDEGGSGGNRAPAPARGQHPAPEAGGPIGKIINAILWWESMGLPVPTRDQVAFVAGYTASGGSFKTYLSRASTTGLVSYEGQGLRILDEGRKIGVKPSRPGTRAELHRRVLEFLDAPLRKILTQLLPLAGQAMTRTQLAESCGYEASGGSFKTYLSRLSSLKLVKYPNKTTVAASPLLFPR